MKKRSELENKFDDLEEERDGLKERMASPSDFNKASEKWEKNSQEIDEATDKLENDNLSD